MNTLILLLNPALLFVYDGKKYWYYAPVAIVAWLSDLWAANTSFRKMAGRGPQNGEKTVSDMLESLCKETTHPHYKLFVEIAKYINTQCPTNNHIKAVV